MPDATITEEEKKYGYEEQKDDEKFLESLGDIVKQQKERQRKKLQSV